MRNFRIWIRIRNDYRTPDSDPLRRKVPAPTVSGSESTTQQKTQDNQYQVGTLLSLGPDSSRADWLIFRRIVDTPTNEMNTDAFVAEVRRMGEELGVACTIIRGEELRYIVCNIHHVVDFSAD